MQEHALTIINRYDLTQSVERFARAIRELAQRVAGEGHPGVLSYRFFVNDIERRAQAVIDYEDTSAWIGHHEIAMSWPEMKTLHSVATLREVTFLGPYTAEIDDWLNKSPIRANLVTGFQLVGGFERARGYRNL